MKVKVVFRKTDYDNEIIAVFPVWYNDDCLVCYTHNEQHSCCGYGYYLGCTKPATPKEYASLLAELQGIYEEVQPIKRLKHIPISNEQLFNTLSW